MTRFPYAISLSLLMLLSACQLRSIEPDSDGELQFDIGSKALEQPTKKRAFQAHDGWFFFDLDFEETYPLLGQTDFMISLAEALRA